MTDRAQKLRIGLYTGRDELLNEGLREEAREKIKIADQQISQNIVLMLLMRTAAK